MTDPERTAVSEIAKIARIRFNSEVNIVEDYRQLHVVALRHAEELDRLRAECEANIVAAGALAKQSDEQAYRDLLEENNSFRTECKALRHDIARAVQTNAELATECDALRKDAERYRWLRDKGPRTSFGGGYCNYEGDLLLTEKLDLFIDGHIDTL